MMQKVAMSALAAPLTFAVAFAANGSSPSKAEIRTEHLVVTVSDEGPSLSVTDRRTGRQWATREDGETSVSEIVRTPSAIGFKLRHGKSNVRYGVLVTPLPQLPEVLVTVSGEGVMNDSLQYPGGFGTKRGDRLILPMNEGISFPVYHDCVCAHWYWGDYSNKLTPIWDRRDLFNALYGTMGMYLFSAGQWEREHDRFVRSYRLISPIARKTGKSEMLDHEILSADRLVQRSTFADGTVVTVNFGTTPFALPGGVSIDAGGVMVR